MIAYVDKAGRIYTLAECGYHLVRGGDCPQCVPQAFLLDQAEAAGLTLWGPEPVPAPEAPTFQQFKATYGPEVARGLAKHYRKEPVVLVRPSATPMAPSELLVHLEGRDLSAPEKAAVNHLIDEVYDGLELDERLRHLCIEVLEEAAKRFPVSPEGTSNPPTTDEAELQDILDALADDGEQL